MIIGHLPSGPSPIARSCAGVGNWIKLPQVDAEPGGCARYCGRRTAGGSTTWLLSTPGLYRGPFKALCSLKTSGLTKIRASHQQVRQGEDTARSSGPLQMNGVGGGSGSAPTSSAGLQLQLQQHGKQQQQQQQQGGAQQELPDSLSTLKSLAEAALPLSSHMGLMQQNHSSELPPGYLDLSGGLQVNIDHYFYVCNLD